MMESRRLSTAAPCAMDDSRVGTRRRLFGVVLAPAIMTVTGCASGSGVPASVELAGLEPYNGTWILDRSATPESGGVRGIRFDLPLEHLGGPPESARNELLAALRVYPRSFTLEITDSIFRLSANAPEETLALPLDGSRIHVESQQVRGGIRVGITWNDGAPAVERSFRANGWILDRYRLTEDGMLIVERTSGFGQWEGTGALRLVYSRGGAGAGQSVPRRAGGRGVLP